MAGENRILTSHVGSLPRPVDWLDMMKARIEGRFHDEAAYELAQGSIALKQTSVKGASKAVERAAE